MFWRVPNSVPCLKINLNAIGSLFAFPPSTAKRLVETHCHCNVSFSPAWTHVSNGNKTHQCQIQWNSVWLVILATFHGWLPSHEYLLLYLGASLRNELSMLIPNLNYWISPTCTWCDENQPIRAKTGTIPILYLWKKIRHVRVHPLLHGWLPWSLDTWSRFACSAVDMMFRQHCCCQNPPCKK